MESENHCGAFFLVDKVSTLPTEPTLDRNEDAIPRLNAAGLNSDFQHNLPSGQGWLFHSLGENIRFD